MSLDTPLPVSFAVVVEDEERRPLRASVFSFSR